MKKIIAVIMASVLITACSNDNSAKRVTELTYKLFDYSANGYYDSLQLLFPNIHLDKFELEADSIRIISANKKENGQMEVQLIKHFSPNHTIEGNLSRGIWLLFDKTEENGCFDYIITNSMGFIDPESIPPYVAQCGALKKNKSYTDEEYIELTKVAEEICKQKAEEVADLLNKKVEIYVTYTNVGGYDFALIDNNTAKFSLKNNTNYSCLGFTVYITICSSWDGKYQGKVQHCYTESYDILQANSEHNYWLSYSSSSVKADKNWKSQIKSATFKITPEAVLQYTTLDFDGTEYDAYMRQHNNNNVGPNDSIKETIDVNGYIYDNDGDFTNIRNSPKGTVIDKIPCGMGRFGAFFDRESNGWWHIKDSQVYDSQTGAYKRLNGDDCWIHKSIIKFSESLNEEK